MTRQKTALITGITGQDGSYLSDFLLEKGYDVHGLVRYDAQTDLSELNNITFHDGDLTDAFNVMSVIKNIAPDEIYNLGAMSHVSVSFKTPASALDINAKGTLNILDAVRALEMEENVRIYQASSSEMFGNAPAPQNEFSPMEPCSPYSIAKLAAYHYARLYRDSYGMHVSNGILFNHESPLRGEHFVTRKITKAVAEIEAGRAEPLSLGNLEALRDWGHAHDYVAGMWMMLQQECGDDYVLATGEAKSVRDFVEAAFAHIGKRIEWQGTGVDEIGMDAKTGKTLVQIDPVFFRPAEVNHLLGDASKAQEMLGWTPQVSFDALVADMVNADRAALAKDENARQENTWQMVG